MTDDRLAQDAAELRGPLVNCPDCDGKGHRDGYACPGFRYVKIPCDSCACAGTVTAETAAQMTALREAGDKLRQDRMERRENIRATAARLGIDVVRYSRAEMGREALP